MEINGGTNFKFVLGDNKLFYQAVQFGAWVRIANKLYKEKLMDALILTTRFDYDQFSLGFSYDINTSDLNQATNSNGAFEFSMDANHHGRRRRDGREGGSGGGGSVEITLCAFSSSC